MRLPIDVLVPEIVDHLRGASALVIEAPTGALKVAARPRDTSAVAIQAPSVPGKTTRVQPAEVAGGEVLVLAPRRLAARSRDKSALAIQAPAGRSTRVPPAALDLATRKHQQIGGIRK